METGTRRPARLWPGVYLSRLVGRSKRGPKSEPASPSSGAEPPNQMHKLMLAVGLSLGSAIALGLTRFSYALLLPAMKTGLGWSFAQAGAMNTANALGYLVGALAFPRLSRRWSVGALFVAGCVATAMLMAACGVVSNTHALLAQRGIAGVTSALIFISGGVLAARLASATPPNAGLVLALYYGGTGWGIVASALLVPLTILTSTHGWRFAWFALAAACVVFSTIAIVAARRIQMGLTISGPTSGPASATDHPLEWARFGLALAGYGFFGAGYIGYMTFIVVMLRKAGMGAAVVTGYYILLGAGTIVSARLWSRLLDRTRGGLALAVLNLLLGTSTLMPHAAYASAGCVCIRRAIRSDLPVCGGVDNGLCPAQPAGESLGQGHQRVHDCICVRTDRRSDGDRLGVGRRGVGARYGLLRATSCGGRLAGGVSEAIGRAATC